MSYCVYKHITPDKRIYIGITRGNPLKRWNNGHGYRGQSVFFNAIIKYGWDNIKHEILYSGLAKEEAEQKETELIAEYKSNNLKYGFNVQSCARKKVIQINKETGRTVNEFSSITEAERITGCSNKHISEVCNGHRKSAYGFYWMFG